ncbi:ScbR family autoregulator-binding transcription factor [Kibdelosporangium phytohabitans]|uniref:A-factor biosynthesis protein n=1 Tax=Kibdelosporangium phytohabitans TaxID=860235 RepID=A0A0N9IEA6_9PSEU|nr:ScbR family autoregulator-binding transcription factor [Kibdelosporangium phytohabitans]ALG13490.1 A-factor biosynthesis protein [Kibdelosporangium phytohabitans]MBE1465339.1 AcrR family transcriptional regulator [Kibdelosporangium phytohabitans]
MPKQQRAERTRATILDAAATVFDRQGFVGASLSDILAEAGVTKGALYFHFASKEELAHALVDEQFSIWPPPGEAGEPGLQNVIDLTQTMARSLRENVRIRASIRLVIEQGTFSEPNPDSYLRWIDVIRGQLDHAKEHGDVRKELNTTEIANFLVGAFTGLQTAAQVLTDRADLPERVATMWRYVLPSIVPPRRLSRFVPEGS